MESDERLCCSSGPESKHVLVPRLSDFKPDRSESLPSFATLQNAISRQQYVAESSVVDEQDENKLMHTYAQSIVHEAYESNMFNYGDNTPGSFFKAIKDCQLHEAIERK